MAATIRLSQQHSCSLGAHGAAWCQAASQPSPDFYKNKQIRLIIGYPVGNDYDLAGRFLARYLAKHIPGAPTIIVQNMPSAASIAAANFLYAQAPRDGTVFGSFSRNMPSQALMGQANVEADPRRFNWLGATSLPARVCVRWVTAPIRTPADLFTQEFIVGGAGAGSSLNILPTVFNHVLGTKFRVIMREAFAAAVRDPELLAEAARIKLDMTYRPPDHLERLVAALYQTPPAFIENVRKPVPSPQ